MLTADTLRRGRDMVDSKNPDLVILDIALPDGNGLEYCQELRGKSGVRILFLSTLNTKDAAISGFKSGGDDYITKPYLMDELMARVEALLRRGRILDMGEPPIHIGELERSFTSRRARLHGVDLLLSPKEFALLEILAKSRGDCFTAQELYQRVWGMEALDDVRTIKAHISRLGRKLGPNSPVTIEATRSVGYRLI